MGADGNSKRILAVDDHPLFRNGIAALLSTQTDMSLVAAASNGRKAIQQFRGHRPDITLMDLQMPDMNGRDALAAIRGEFPDARIIILTTYCGDVQGAMKLGARAYLLRDKAGWKGSLDAKTRRPSRGIGSFRRSQTEEVWTSSSLAIHRSEWA